MFKSQLHEHHAGEDTALWPTIRPRLTGRRDDLELLDVMETEHARIGALIEQIDTAVAEALASSCPHILLEPIQSGARGRWPSSRPHFDC